MKLPRNKTALAALTAFAAFAALPAVGQDAEAPPESLLPPGFGDPVAPQPPPPLTPTPPSGAQPIPPPRAAPSPFLPEEEDETDEESEDEDEVYAGPLISNVPIQPITSTGPLAYGRGGLAPDAFGASDGVMLTRLMRRLDAPLPSRWASILLRRALLSDAATPRGVTAPDWIAERAWLLLRMGEADSARLLIQQVDPRLYTPKLYDVAMQTALALGDPGALCPIHESASRIHRATGWILARAMCASLSGEPGTASAAIDQARRTRLAGRTTVDLLLAEKVVGAGENSRRNVTIEWDGVEQLTSWRYGLASATAVEIPPALFATVGPHVRAWQARAPFLADGERIAAAKRAAALGVFSSGALVDLYSGLLERTDPADQAGTPMVRLREAYSGRDFAARLEALKALWDDGEEQDDFANLILTARAAARVPVEEGYLGSSRQLLSSMLTAGLDTRAAEWSALVNDGDDQDSWAMLALASPRPLVTVSGGRASDYADATTPHKGGLLIAGLAGLGRIELGEAVALASDLEFDMLAETRWTRLLDRAVEARQPGTVALLAAVGMQTLDWDYVPPAHLYRIVSALRGVGLEGEARMIAAEAIART